MTGGRIDPTRLLVVFAAAAVTPGLLAAPASADTIDPAPGADLAAMVSNYPAGTTFQLEAGVYPVNKSIHLKSGDSIVGLGQGVTVLDGAGASYDGISAYNDTGVHISGLTVRGFHDGVLVAGGATVDSVESGSNAETGIQVIGDGSVVQNCNVHDNGRFGIYVNGGSNDQVINNQVIHNHTSKNWTVGYAAGIKVINFAVNDLVQGNTVTDTWGHGIWTDNSSNGTQIIGNTVLGSSDEGIRLEKSYNTFVSGNTSNTGFNSLDSSGAVVEGNTFSSPGTIWPLRFAGNGRKDNSGVEYANVNNSAQGNDVTIASGQKVGVVRVAGSSSGNTFSADTYHVPSTTNRWFSWWNGAARSSVGWSTWTTTYAQDVTGTLAGPLAALRILSGSNTTRNGGHAKHHHRHHHRHHHSHRRGARRGARRTAHHRLARRG